MSISDDYIGDDYEYDVDEESKRLAEGFPVRLVADETPTVIKGAPDFGTCMTWTVPQFGVNAPIQILQRRIYRYKAKMIMVSVTAATSLVISNRVDTLSIPQGVTYPVPAAFPLLLKDWESQQPAYAIAVGGTLILSVLDESFGE